MSKRFPIFLSIFSLLMLLTVSARAERPREIWERYTVAFVGKDSAAFINGPILQGAQDAAKVLEHQHNLAITLVNLTPATGSTQSDALKEAFVQRANAVLISVIDPASIDTELQLFARQNIAVVTIDGDAPAELRVATITSDNAALGQLAFSEAASQLPRGGQLAVLAGDADKPANQERLAAIQSAAEANPRVGIIGVYPCVESVDGAINTLREALAADHDDEIDGWIFLGAWPLLGVTPLPWEPGEQVCVGVGALPPMLGYLQKKQVGALIDQLYYRWGYLSMEAAINKVHLKQNPPESVIETGGNVITRKNLQSYSQDWAKWMQ